MLTEQIARGVGRGNIDIAYARLGDPADPPVLLVMGLAGQLVNWPGGFLEALVARRLQAIVFDNRDAGHSTHFSAAPIPNLTAALSGDFSSAAYTLSDMATDAVDLLDFLGIAKAHLVGASMGGAIAQMVAIAYPDRVLSLTSMMFTTGAKSIGEPHPETLAGVFGGPPATTREQVVERAIRASAIVGSPAYRTEPSIVADRAGRAWDRDHDEVAVARQAVATVATGDRTERLKHVAIPTLVIHGTHDAMVDVSGGRATAAAIPNAELVLVDGMGHDLPAALWNGLTGHIAAIVRRGEVAAIDRGAR